MQHQFLSIFQKHVPPAAVDYCFELWQNNPFSLKITKARASKLGDYCFRPNTGHQITVNHDLKPEAFLITYLHEVAHLHTYKQFGSKKAPHGKEWKSQFRAILKPILVPSVFSEDVLKALIAYSQNPLASTGAFAPLREALQDQQSTELNLGLIKVNALLEGQKFMLNHKVFEKNTLRRTRILCTEINTGRKYTILHTTLVKVFV